MSNDPTGRRRVLSDLAAGATAKVVGVEGPPEIVRRLGELGVLKGVGVRVVRRAPFGCPLEFDLEGVRYAVRRATAAAVYVDEESA
jgi:ferrous iron transport protein A